jgi:two-component system response regulator
MNPLKILAAEDNVDDVFILREALRKAGISYRVEDVGDGAAVLAYLSGEGAYSDRNRYPFPDVLLLDLNMPRLDGFEVLECVRQDPRFKRLIVYVLTASSRDADVQRAYDLGANGYLLKPVRMDETVALIAALHQWHQFIRLPMQPKTQKPLSAEAL